MAKHKRTELILENAISVLADYHPMTVRQVYYRLVSRQIIDNNRSQYQAVSNILVEARKSGAIPWGWIEDRLRKPRHISMWDDLADFAHTAVHSYRLNTWATQAGYVECWLEKDALSGVFEQVLADYGITLNVGRGYDGWDSIHAAAMRFGTGKGITVLYYGDFDPSGEDMVRSLQERLAFFGCVPEIVKCALTLDDVQRYNLPPDFAKKTDTRAAAFIEKWGDMAVELDALPPDVLQTSLKNEVEKRMDLAALADVKLQEAADKEALLEKLSS